MWSPIFSSLLLRTNAFWESPIYISISSLTIPHHIKFRLWCIPCKPQWACKVAWWTFPPFLGKSSTQRKEKVTVTHTSIHKSRHRSQLLSLPNKECSVTVNRRELTTHDIRAWKKSVLQFQFTQFQLLDLLLSFCHSYSCNELEILFCLFLSHPVTPKTKGPHFFVQLSLSYQRLCKCHSRRKFNSQPQSWI